MKLELHFFAERLLIIDEVRQQITQSLVHLSETLDPAEIRSIVDHRTDEAMKALNAFITVAGQVVAQFDTETFESSVMKRPDVMAKKRNKR